MRTGEDLGCPEEMPGSARERREGQPPLLTPHHHSDPLKPRPPGRGPSCRWQFSLPWFPSPRLKPYHLQPLKLWGYLLPHLYGPLQSSRGLNYLK